MDTAGDGIDLCELCGREARPTRIAIRRRLKTGKNFDWTAGCDMGVRDFLKISGTLSSICENMMHYWLQWRPIADHVVQRLIQTSRSITILGMTIIRKTVNMQSSAATWQRFRSKRVGTSLERTSLSDHPLTRAPMATTYPASNSHSQGV